MPRHVNSCITDIGPKNAKLSCAEENTNAVLFRDRPSMSYNFNIGGDGRHGTRMDLRRMEDRQVRARVPRGGGVGQTTRAGVIRGEGEDNTCPCLGGEQPRRPW